MTILGASFSGLIAALSLSSATSPPARAAADQDVSSSGALRCSALVGQRLGGATVDKAEYLVRGSPTIAPTVKAATNVCRLSVHASPVPGSAIRIRVWLPDNWNGKMLGVGGAGLNGGFAAEWFIMIGPLNRGYAAFSTDAGHDPSDDGKWAFGQPQKIVDYGYRANHSGTIAAKAAIASYYGRPARRSYFHGCSNGGRDALIQAQRYPRDYDGIIAGAPANEFTALMATFARDAQIARPFLGAHSLAPKLEMVHVAALRMCDSADGAKDGLISNPTTCRFDPVALQCRDGTGPSCLSRAEVAALRAIYRGTRTSDGRVIMPGFPPGSELNWSDWFTKPDKDVPGMVQDVYRYMVYNDPRWDWTTFDLDRDYPVMKRRLAPIIDATDADLRPFVRHGGKLLMYHGWEDPAIPAGNSIRYYNAVRRVLARQSNSVRLFMVPGMGHCFGGSGPNVIDLVDALDDWVEGGGAPGRLISRKYDNFMAALTEQPAKLLQTRPVCAWPKTPYYRGSGPVNQESSFVCR